MKHPTPLEWMAYHDDELEPARRRELDQWLDQHPEEQARLALRGRLHHAVHEAVNALPLPGTEIDLTDSIMGAIARETNEIPPIKSAPRLRALPAPEPPEPPPPAPVELRPARSPLRWPLAATLVAAAAAAALLVWRSPAPSPELTSSAESPSHAVASPEVLASLTDDDATIGDDGSAITSIEFGAQSGAIFYVRGQTTASAVLWLDDNEASP